jgi:hypothetical protein
VEAYDALLARGMLPNDKTMFQVISCLVDGVYLPCSLLPGPSQCNAMQCNVRLSHHRIAAAGRMDEANQLFERGCKDGTLAYMLLKSGPDRLVCCAVLVLCCMAHFGANH